MNHDIDALFARWARPDSPGCMVAVSHGGSTVHARGYGMADLELGVPITPATIFHVASISKQITGFLVLLLAEEGRLRLDADIRTYVPEVPSFGARITLRHLLHHTSGLRDHFTLMKLAGVRPMDEKSESDIFALLARQKALNFRPGADFNYCNTGWVLLACAASRATGEPFRECVEKKVFRPLGMTSSSVRDNHTTLIAGRAAAYDDGPKYYVPNFDFTGSTGVQTTAADLLRWAENIIHPHAGRSEIVRQLTTPGKLKDGRSVRYGAGVEIGTYRGLEIVKHRGWDLGYSAYLAMYPEPRLAVAILGNISTLPTATLGARIADVALASHFPAPRPQPAGVPEHVLRAKTGLYRHVRTHRAFWIRLVDRELRFAAEPAAAGVPLRALDATTFQAATETATFMLDGKTLTMREDSGVDQRYRRARPWTPDARALAAFAGTYRSAELDERLTFTVDTGTLVGKRRRWRARSLSPAYADSFTDDIATYRFVRDRRGAVEAVVLALDRIFHLRYEREAARKRRGRRG